MRKREGRRKMHPTPGVGSDRRGIAVEIRVSPKVREKSGFLEKLLVLFC